MNPAMTESERKENIWCIGLTTALENKITLDNLLWFMAKKWVKILIVSLFRLKFDNVIVTLSLIVLS